MIEQLFIENYKSIRNAKIELRHLNVLIGSNGVGKSNFISFFELLQALLNQRLGSYMLSRGGIDRILYQGRKHSNFLRSLIDFQNTNAFFFELKPAVGGKAFIEYTGDYFNTSGESAKDYEKKWNKTIWDKAAEESEIMSNAQWRAGYLRTFLKSFTVYHFHDTSATSPMRQACKISDNESLRHDASNLAAYLYRLQETEPKTFKLIEGVVRSIAPYFKGFKLSASRLSPDQITLEWEETESDMYLDANSFSDGTLRFIALATLLLQPNQPETIIIDEPELGLHPTAINKLAALVRKASLKKQIILATQSVNLVNCFTPEDIIVVDRKDRQTTFSRLNTEELATWIDEYSIGDIWEKNVIGGQP